MNHRLGRWTLRTEPTLVKRAHWQWRHWLSLATYKSDTIGPYFQLTVFGYSVILYGVRA